MQPTPASTSTIITLMTDITVLHSSIITGNNIITLIVAKNICVPLLSSCHPETLLHFLVHVEFRGHWHISSTWITLITCWKCETWNKHGDSSWGPGTLGKAGPKMTPCQAVFTREWMLSCENLQKCIAFVIFHNSETDLLVVRSNNYRRGKFQYQH